MHQVEFEPMTPVLERAKTVHALDRAASVLGMFVFGVVFAC
jgi:mannose/fructose/N-acetylgalactosamine-specific phosphotransferase system component IID